MTPYAPRFVRLLVRLTLVGTVSAGMFIHAGCSPTKGDHKTAASTSEVKPNKPVYTSQDRALDLASFEYVWTTIRDKHYDATMGGLDWPAVRDELKPRVEAASSREEARDVMHELVHRLGKSHFGIVPAAAYADDSADGVVTNDTAAAPSETNGAGGVQTAEGSASKPKPARDRTGEGSTGIDLRIDNASAMVTDVAPGSAAELAGIKPGWLITGIDGNDVPAVIKRMDESFPDSTSKAYYIAEAVAGQLGGRTGDTVSIDFIDERDERITKELTLAPMEGTKAQFGNLPTLYVFTRSVRLPENVQYFKLNIFFDPASVMAALGESVKEAQTNNADGFIIDLRGNPGGIGAMAMGFAGWFVQDKDQKLGTMSMRSGTMNFLVNPRTRGFSGPLAVLVDGMSGSTSEIFAAGMQDLKRARLFGTRTAGAALPSTFEVLPNQDRFQYAIADYTSVSGRSIEGNGVSPDEEVKLDRASLLAGRDPVIDAAVKWIKSAPRTTVMQTHSPSLHEGAKP